ncbi:MAG: hypothetical protein ACKVOU_09960 [Cytophagales bacterium]
MKNSLSKYLKISILLVVLSQSANCQQKFVFGDSLCNFTKLTIPTLVSGEYNLKINCDTLYLVSARKMQIFRLQDQLLQIATKKQDVTGNMLNNYQIALKKNDEYYENLYSQYKALDKSSTNFSNYTKENLKQASDTLASVNQTLKLASNQLNGIEKAVKAELSMAKKEKWKYGIVGILLGGAVSSTILLMSR